MEYNCIYCKSIFKCPPSVYKAGRRYCSKLCSARGSPNTYFKVANPMYNPILKAKIIKQIKGRIPWNKNINRTQNTKDKISITLKEKYKKGLKVWNKDLTKKNNPDKITYGCIGDKNPSKRLKHRKNHSEWAKKFYKKYPEKHPNYIMGQKGFVSKPQKELYNLIKKTYISSQLEYPIKTHGSVRFADVAIPTRKIDIEYDGEYWHKNRKNEDNKRDMELKKLNWITIRVNKKNIEHFKIHYKTIIREAHNGRRF